MAQDNTLVNGWQPVIGLSHVQLSTNTKLFSPSRNQFGAEETSGRFNRSRASWCPAYVERGAIKQGIKFGLATNAEIAETMVFDRRIIFIQICQKAIK